MVHIPENKDKDQNAKITPTMPIKIPELEGYFGGKGGSGVYQNIINLIPPHKRFAVPFLGHCGITRNILPATTTLVNDIDPAVIRHWTDYYNSNPFGRNKNGTLDDMWFHNLHWEVFLTYYKFDQSDSFIYWDPPYPKKTRKSNHQYTFEMTDDDHVTLLSRLLGFKKAMQAISTYDNPLYQEMLGGAGWNKKSFQARTRQGVATETVYFNYPPLHGCTTTNISVTTIKRGNISN
ncbi:hypothetical protein [Flagellimonas marina]|uniref:DNA adenine methylase n=1 Tax=Flagellimonas marina TaxID=1775168 RepID=A0ABV8PJB6_9FLAO